MTERAKVLYSPAECGILQVDRGDAPQEQGQKEAEMHRVKIFKRVERETAKLEEEINAWLAETGVRIVSITGNIAPQTPDPNIKPKGTDRLAFFPSDILVIIVYEG